jgi:hypothetical protein
MIEFLTFEKTWNLNHFVNYLYLKTLCKKDSSNVNHSLFLLIKKFKENDLFQIDQTVHSICFSWIFF